MNAIFQNGHKIFLLYVEKSSPPVGIVATTSDHQQKRSFSRSGLVNQTGHITHKNLNYRLLFLPAYKSPIFSDSVGSFPCFIYHMRI